jgi:hypothetical protein
VARLSLERLDGSIRGTFSASSIAVSTSDAAGDVVSLRRAAGMYTTCRT